MKLTSVTVSREGEPVIEGADGQTKDGLVQVRAENPGFSAGENVQITGEPGFNSPASYIDDDGGTLNFKIL